MDSESLGESNMIKKIKSNFLAAIIATFFMISILIFAGGIALATEDMPEPGDGQ